MPRSCLSAVPVAVGDCPSSVKPQLSSLPIPPLPPPSRLYLFLACAVLTNTHHVLRAAAIPGRPLRRRRTSHQPTITSPNSFADPQTLLYQRPAEPRFANNDYPVSYPSQTSLHDNDGGYQPRSNIPAPIPLTPFGRPAQYDAVDGQEDVAQHQSGVNSYLAEQDRKKKRSKYIVRGRIYLVPTKQV